MDKGEIRLTKEQQDALAYSDHISLTANAGSGKTFILTMRYLEITLGESVPLRRMAAITFTEKAAGELYKKIAETVNKLLESTDNPDKIKELERVRRELISANIQTIHSFCSDILREYPVEAGIDANFSGLDAAESAELIELAVEDTIRKALKSDEIGDSIKFLIRMAGSLGSFSSMLKELIHSRHNIFAVAERLYAGTADETAMKFNELYDEYAGKLLTLTREGFLSRMHAINERAGSPPDVSTLLEEMEEADNGEFIEKAAGLAERILTKSGSTLKKRDYLGSKDREGLEKEIVKVENDFKLFATLLPGPDSELANNELANFGNRFLPVFYKAVENYEQRKANHGQLDFEDLLILTGNLLKNDDVRNALTDRYRYIMVDEYQDTNEIQYDIFLPILDHLKEGNLFVVGDEKQSIYRFRDADLAVFERTRDDIREKSGERQLKTLPASFRMAPPLCAFSNYLFRELFSEPKKIFNEVKPTDIISAKKEELSGRVEVLLAASSHNEGAGITEPESELTARKILLLMNDKDELHLEWKDIAVLCRKRKSFAELERTFFRNGIPFSVVGGTGFYQRQMINDLYNYLSFLLNRGDDTALVGVLRSPFFSVSDADLYEISRFPGETFFDKLIAASEERPEWKKSADLLHENSLLAVSLPINAIIRKITTETPFLSVMAGRPAGVQEIANFEKLLRLTIGYTEQGFRNLYDFVMFLGSAIEKLSDEGQASVLQESDSVKIMTIHQAKGLEFKAVFLYNSHESSPSGGVKAGEITVSRTFGILTKVKRPGDFFSDTITPPTVHLHNYLNYRRNEAELKRLFYVAVTRAKNYLCISGQIPSRGDFSEGSFFRFLKDALEVQELSGTFEIQDQLDILDVTRDDLPVKRVDIALSIPVITEIESVERYEKDSEEKSSVHRETAVLPMEDSPSGEFISATKLAVFTQCPAKYQLTYEFGYQTVFNRYKEWLKTQREIFEFKEREDEETEEEKKQVLLESGMWLGQLKGNIIHAILDKNVPEDELGKFIEMKYFALLTPAFRDDAALELLQQDIMHDLQRFRNSAVYKEIQSYPDFKNEFSLYARAQDFFLYGIIDKIIDTGKEIIIVDYKTDAVGEEKLNSRARHYFIQLAFYALIADIFYRGKRKILLRLLFIRHPEIPFTKEMTKKELQLVGEQVTEMVKVIRERSFSKNRKHCAECNYSVNPRTCILDGGI